MLRHGKSKCSFYRIVNVLLLAFRIFKAIKKKPSTLSKRTTILFFGDLIGLEDWRSGDLGARRRLGTRSRSGTKRLFGSRADWNKEAALERHRDRQGSAQGVHANDNEPRWLTPVVIGHVGKIIKDG